MSIPKDTNTFCVVVSLSLSVSLARSEVSRNLAQLILLNFSLQVDVTDKASIAKAKKFIEEKEGKLHVLVNK